MHHLHAAVAILRTAVATTGRVIGFPARHRQVRAPLIGISVTVLLIAGLAGPAAADTKGQTPGKFLNCGAMRDVPSEWTVAPYPGYCKGWGYSYILTNPSNVHHATWEWSPTTGPVSGTLGTEDDPLEVWVPSHDAGATAEYDYQYCGSSTWIKVGDLNQNADSGWYTPGTLHLEPFTPVCAVREFNVQSSSLYLAEDAIGLRD